MLNKNLAIIKNSNQSGVCDIMIALCLQETKDFLFIYVTSLGMFFGSKGIAPLYRWGK